MQTAVRMIAESMIQMTKSRTTSAVVIKDSWASGSKHLLTLYKTEDSFNRYGWITNS
jgi:hypothetical protein